MKFSKDQYILRNFSKIQHKQWELYIITRIVHNLNDPEIEFVCQQLIKTSDGKRYLADLCFPSLKLYYEIDEAHVYGHDDEDSEMEEKLDAVDEVHAEALRIVENEARAYKGMLNDTKQRLKAAQDGLDDQARLRAELKAAQDEIAGADDRAREKVHV